MITSLISNTESYKLSLELYPKVVELAEGLGKIGVGIGAIMLLIVVIYHITAMLDGGRFQMKMLIPLLLFFIVCNFTWIAKPVLFFTTTLTETLSTKLVELKKGVLNPDDMDDITTICDSYIAYKLEDDPTNPNYKGHATDNDQGEETSAPLSSVSAKGFGGVIVKGVFETSANSISQDFATTKNEEVRKKKTSETHSGPGLLCRLVTWLCVAFGYCLKVFGIMMTSIVVAFGPITFAFAILPGRGSNIASWFIRICQFALYGPLCYFLDAFTSCAYKLLDSGTSSVGWTVVFALTIANLVGLLSVPTIASMIIEGASGAVSLSQGLQSIGGATMTTGGFLMNASLGKNNVIPNFLEGLKHKGALGVVREMSGSGFKGAMKNIEQVGRQARFGPGMMNGSPTGNQSGSGK